MKQNPAQILALLYAIKPETIARDLRQTEDQLRAVATSLARLTDIEFTQRSPADEAQIAHLMMVQAHELFRSVHVLPEFKVFYAGFGVGNIVQMAETVAMDQGRLAELCHQMEDIRRREGLAPEEDWLYQRGPADHRTLEEEAMELGTSVADTVMISVLNRYGLQEQARLYEHDRRQWNFLREIGARVVSGHPDGGDEAEKFTDRYLTKKYGGEFVQDIHRRTAILREAVRRARPA